MGKPIAAFLEFARQQDLVETQLELRGQLYGQLTAKPLLTNPTGPRPEKRNDGFNRKGPQGLQNVTSKASTMLGELPPPPPLPPRIATDPLADVPPALPLPKIRPVDQASSASHVLPPVHPPFLIPGLPVDLWPCASTSTSTCLPAACRSTVLPTQSEIEISMERTRESYLS